MIVGGTVEKDVYSDVSDDNEFKAIFSRCKKIVPSLEVRVEFNES